ncbi:MAG: hypothetical protein K5694_05670, partial [Bacilli bacterium]|nr:hypothetical protein [Bacilli bacterium]
MKYNVLIIAAMEKEVSLLLESSDLIGKREVGYAKIHELRYRGKDFLLVTSGIGKGFAASALSAALALYPEVKKVIN